MSDLAAVVRHPGQGEGAGGRAGSAWRAGARIAVALTAMAVALSGCSQPGTQASKAQAARIAVATGDIATACGYALEATAFDHRAAVSAQESMAYQGALKLAGVYDRDQSDIYQGESIGGVLNGAIALLGDCGLSHARIPLRHALATHH